MSYVNVRLGEINTYDDWGLQLEKIQLSFPEPKTDLVNIPGADGVLDLTEINGPVRYNNRTLTLTFSQVIDYDDWHTLVSQIARTLHGKVVRCTLPDDPNYFYQGRFALETTKEDDTTAGVVIVGNVEPYKMDVAASDEAWLWDIFSFDYGLIREYSGILVNGTAEITVVGSARMEVPTIIASATMQLEFDGRTYRLAAGENIEYDIVIQDDEYLFKFIGSGTVTIRYRGGML